MEPHECFLKKIMPSPLRKIILSENDVFYKDDTRSMTLFDIIEYGPLKLKAVELFV